MVPRTLVPMLKRPGTREVGTAQEGQGLQSCSQLLGEGQGAVGTNRVPRARAWPSAALEGALPTTLLARLQSGAPEQQQRLLHPRRPSCPPPKAMRERRR